MHELMTTTATTDLAKMSQPEGNIVYVYEPSTSGSTYTVQPHPPSRRDERPSR